MLSLREFAKRAGVSRTTVSRAFSGSDKIAPKTRQRLLELAAAMDFRPSPVLRPAVQGSRTHSIGVLYPALGPSYFQDIQRGLQETLLEQGILPIILGVNMQNIHQCLNRLVDHRVEGLVVPSWTQRLTAADLERLHRLNLPIVWLGHGEVGTDRVDTDDVAGGIAAARHLLDLGHRQIGIVHPGHDDARYTAFRAELDRQGVPFDAERLVTLDQSDPGWARAVAALLTADPRPTAVFCWTDGHAADLYRVAAGLGLPIPADLSVVGYADLNYAQFLSPPLTTVRQDGYQVGRHAADLVVRRVAGDTSPPRQICVPTALVVRESTAPPPELP